MFPCGSARRRPRQGPSGPALRFRPWLGFVIPLCCAGCLVGPDFSAPSAPVAEKWLEANNPSADTRNQEYRDWWTVFHDPVLNRLVESAYNQNLTLVSAGTRVLQARAQLGVAIGEFYPQRAGAMNLAIRIGAGPRVGVSMWGASTNFVTKPDGC